MNRMIFQVIGGAPSLDMMLGDLQEDMNKQGVKTKQKGVCWVCSKPILGQVKHSLSIIFKSKMLNFESGDNSSW